MTATETIHATEVLRGMKYQQPLHTKVSHWGHMLHQQRFTAGQAHIQNS